MSQDGNKLNQYL